MHNLATNISGKIFRDKLNGGATGYSIGVNASEGFRRKRFTVAHEIAHYILHLDKIGDELTDDAMYRSGLSTREEVQANNLAADIIMPISLIRQLQGLGMDSVSALADALQVSEPAMRVRLSYL
jgi:Zn-dependent peptidase ImmA (M78 family)